MVRVTSSLRRDVSFAIRTSCLKGILDINQRGNACHKDGGAMREYLHIV